jgi:hypothetical protein
MQPNHQQTRQSKRFERFWHERILTFLVIVFNP